MKGHYISVNVSICEHLTAESFNHDSLGFCLLYCVYKTRQCVCSLVFDWSVPAAQVIYMIFLLHLGC